MTSTTKLVLAVATIAALTNATVYYHLRLKPDDLTLPFFTLVTVAEFVPLTLVIWIWHRRG